MGIIFLNLRPDQVTEQSGAAPTLPIYSVKRDELQYAEDITEIASPWSVAHPLAVPLRQDFLSWCPEYVDWDGIHAYGLLDENPNDPERFDRSPFILGLRDPAHDLTKPKNPTADKYDVLVRVHNTSVFALMDINGRIEQKYDKYKLTKESPEVVEKDELFDVIAEFTPFRFDFVEPVTLFSPYSNLWVRGPAFWPGSNPGYCSPVQHELIQGQDPEVFFSIDNETYDAKDGFQEVDFDGRCVKRVRVELTGQMGYCLSEREYRIEPPGNGYYYSRVEKYRTLQYRLPYIEISSMIHSVAL